MNFCFCNISATITGLKIKSCHSMTFYIHCLLCHILETVKNKRLFFKKISFTDNFLTPIPVSDWLIFCCRKIISKKRNENDKNRNFMMKSNKNMKV